MPVSQTAPLTSPACCKSFSSICNGVASALTAATALPLPRSQPPAACTVKFPLKFQLFYFPGSSVCCSCGLGSILKAKNHIKMYKMQKEFNSDKLKASLSLSACICHLFPLLWHILSSVKFFIRDLLSHPHTLLQLWLFSRFSHPNCEFFCCLLVFFILFFLRPAGAKCYQNFIFLIWFVSRLSLSWHKEYQNMRPLYYIPYAECKKPLSNPNGENGTSFMV